MTIQAKLPKYSKLWNEGTRVILRDTGQSGIVVGRAEAGLLIRDETPVAVRFDWGVEPCKETDLLIDVLPKYLDSLDPIYRDIFRAFWTFNPNGRPEWGVAYQSIYSALSEKYTLGQIREACNELVRHQALELRGDQFYHPTPMGEGIIWAIQKLESQMKTTTPPPFQPPV